MSNKKNRRHTSGRRGKHKRISPVVLFIVVAVAAVVIAFIAIAAAVYTSDSGKSGNGQDTPEEEQQAEGLAFPYKLGDGKISIDSIIQFSGPNVDADNQESENIAGIEVENISEQYIEEAAVRLTMADDTEYRFLIQDLPVGGKTVAFELDSQEYDGATACKEAACEVQNQDITMAEDRVSVRTDGSKVIITNISEQQIDSAEVIYRCTTGDSYIGGLSYEIPVSGLAGGESFEYEDSKCLLGTPEAVGVEID